MGLLSYERYLEESLDRGLSAYLGPERFIVQVKAILSEPSLMRYAQPPQPVMPTPNPQPALRPSLEEEPPVLPGLAPDSHPLPAPTLGELVLPTPQPQAQVVGGDERPEGRGIERLRVSVVLPSTLSSKDEDFIRNMVMQKVDHQFARDLVIDLSRREFPALPPTLPAQEGLPPWLWPLLAAIGGLGIGLVFARLRRAPADSALVTQPTIAPSAPQVTSIDPPRPSSEALRHELTMLLLSEPELAERYMGQLLEQEMGVARAAVLTRTLGGTVSRRLFPGIPEESWRAIELQQFERTELTAEEIQLALSEAIRAIGRERHASHARPPQRRQDPFAFLETLDDSQILYILQEEPPRVQALVYSQLPPERAIGLMQLMNPGEVGTLTAAMGDLSSIPIAAFHDIALHLAQKAAEAPRFSTAVTNGVDLLVGLLDHSSREMENRILKELSTQNPQLLKQVRQNYLAFDDIPKLPKEVLRDAVRDFPKEQLAEVLRDAPLGVVSALTGALNERGRLIVEDALKGPSLLDLTPPAKEAMRRELLTRIRQASRTLIIPQSGGN
jgi:flagellar motor switch protein FliG